MSSDSNALASLWARRTRTPDRLRLMLIAAVVLAIVASVVVNIVVSTRGGATRSIDEDHEPAIEAAQRVQTSLAEADAAAANAFLAGGGEDPVQRQRYEQSLAEASDALAIVISKVGGDEGLLTTATSIEKTMVEYSGLVESARANNRQNFPIGAAYLSTASSLLEADLYPATDAIANSRADSYRSSYNDQVGIVGSALLVVLFLVLICLVGFLLLCHRYLSKKFRRTVNVPVLVAVLLSFGVLAWSTAAVAGQTSSMQTAREAGYNDVRSLINLRGLGFRAQNEESQFLIARGAIPESEFSVETDKVSALLEDLLTETTGDTTSGLDPNEVELLQTRWEAYRATRQGVKDLAVAGDRSEAIDLALGDSALAFDSFDAEVEKLLTGSQTSFEVEMDSARSSLRFLDLVGPFLLLSGAVLMFFGMQQRIREYR